MVSTYFEAGNIAKMSIFSTHFYRWPFTEDAYKNILSTNLFAPTTKYFTRVLCTNMTAELALKGAFLIQGQNYVSVCIK